MNKYTVYCNDQLATLEDRHHSKYLKHEDDLDSFEVVTLYVSTYLGPESPGLLWLNHRIRSAIDTPLKIPNTDKVIEVKII